MNASELQAGMRLGAQVTTNGVDLSFPAAANLAYSVLFRTNLAAGLWEKLADVPAQPTNSMAQVTDPAAVLPHGDAAFAVAKTAPLGAPCL